LGVICGCGGGSWCRGHLLQNPVLSPTAKQLQSSLNEIERTTVELGLSRGVRVFMLMGCDALKERTQVTSVEGLMSKMADAACSTDKRTPQEDEPVSGIRVEIRLSDTGVLMQQKSMLHLHSGKTALGWG